jgi:hypothetical protein
MKIKLRFVWENYITRNRVSVFLQEDGNYFVLTTPLNATNANDLNVHEYKDLSLSEALRMAHV